MINILYTLLPSLWVRWPMMIDDLHVASSPGQASSGYFKTAFFVCTKIYIMHFRQYGRKT